MLCEALTREQYELETLCRFVGIRADHEVWLSLVEISDAFTQYVELRKNIERELCPLGIDVGDGQS